jgi:cyclohexanecarboxyl-CoA dehydrogenase
MDFTFSAEQEELIRTLRVFARRELAPHSHEWDGTREFPWAMWRRMGELGLFGLRVPSQYGGQETDLLTTGIAIEEIAHGDFSCTGGMQLALLAAEILGREGSEEVKKQWLPPMVRGEAIISLALTEPGVGSDAANLVCRAERSGNEYVITGEKSGITFGMVSQAVVVFARTGAEAGARGITAFLVPFDRPGISRSPLRDLGCRLMQRAVLAFDHVRIPESHRIGREGAGFYQVMRGFDYNRLMIALACLGVAEVSLDETMAYVKERRAFGRSLAQFEGVSFPIAEAATQLDAAKWFCYRGLSLVDRGLPYTKESAMAKWWVPKISVEVIHQCLLFHGHYGYTEELPFEQRLRDVLGFEIGDGTAEVSKIVAARELLGRESRPY